MLITASAEDTEVHPEALVTVNVYVPGSRPVMFTVGPVPSDIVPSCDLVNVHVPEDGRPFNCILPVATEHVGWVMVPMTGAAGVTGCVIITTSPDGPEIHPEAFVTVNE